MSSLKQRGSIPAAFALAVMVTICGYVYADCTSYSNSRVEYHGGQAVCAGYGSGCTECTDGGGGGCVTNGSSCTPETRN